MGLRPLSWGYPGDAEPSPSPRVWFTTLGAPWQARGGKFHDSHKARGGSQQLLCSGLSGSSPSRCSRPGGQGREAALSYRHWHGCSPRINPGAPSSPLDKAGVSEAPSELLRRGLQKAGSAVKPTLGRSPSRVGVGHRCFPRCQRGTANPHPTSVLAPCIPPTAPGSPAPHPMPLEGTCPLPGSHPSASAAAPKEVGLEGLTPPWQHRGTKGSFSTHLGSHLSWRAHWPLGSLRALEDRQTDTQTVGRSRPGPSLGSEA